MSTTAMSLSQVCAAFRSAVVFGRPRSPTPYRRICDIFARNGVKSRCRWAMAVGAPPTLGFLSRLLGTHCHCPRARLSAIILCRSLTVALKASMWMRMCAIRFEVVNHRTSFTGQAKLRARHSHVARECDGQCRKERAMKTRRHSRPTLPAARSSHLACPAADLRRHW